MFDNPLAVQQGGPEVVPNPSPEQQSDIAGQWRNWLANEGNRAALMQFGVALMQPMDFGQTPAGHVGQAIGQVGELGTRRETAARQQQEADSREQQRMSQAQLAEARAANAGASAGAATERLAFQRERLAADERFRHVRTALQARTAYSNEVRRIRDANQIARPGQEQAIPTYEEWARRAGLSHLLPGAGTTSDPNETPAPGIEPEAGGRTYPQPSPQAIELLRRTPNMRAQFEAVHGPGSAARYLGR